MREIEALADPLRASGEVVSVFSIAGMGGQDNRGFVVVTLATGPPAAAASRTSRPSCRRACAG
jgi:hypothetical protein